MQALVSETQAADVEERYGLIHLEVNSMMGETPMAKIVLHVDGSEVQSEAEGSGPVDAAFKAIENIAKSEANLELYSVNAITKGTDSQGEVTVRLEHGGRVVNGHGADTDIIIASVKAYLKALNMIASGLKKTHPQVADV